MITRWLQTAVNLLLYFCAATLLAELIIAAYLWSAWQLDREKIIQMLAVAQGIDLLGAQEQAPTSQQPLVPEQPSYDDWLEKRAAKFRDLELRELALKNAVEQLRSEQQRLAADQQANKQLIADFQARLLALKQGAQAQGRQTVSHILETIKPKQAKEHILQMLDNDEVAEVVMILGEMTESKRAKILGEFKTPEESQKIGEVLRLIRQGEPVSSMAQEMLGQLSQQAPTGS